MQNHIYGIHSVTAFLQQQPELILEIWISREIKDNRLQEILLLAKDFGIKVQQAKKESLDQKTDHASHQGVVAKIVPPKELNENDLQDLLAITTQPFFLILDGVTDPHNLGACLRSADAAGISAVIIPKNNTTSITAVTRKVACGAAEKVPLIRVTNLARTINNLKEHNIWVVGTAGEATESIYQTKLTGAIALVMGAEETGLRRLTRESCDLLVKIPLFGSVSSLNVSVATGVCLFEIVRQRQKQI